MPLEPLPGIASINSDDGDGCNHSSGQTGNIEHTVEAIHAILKSHYKVSRQRSVDVVRTQAVDSFLLAGSEKSLNYFTPSFVCLRRGRRFDKDTKCFVI